MSKSKQDFWCEGGNKYHSELKKWAKISLYNYGFIKNPTKARCKECGRRLKLKTNDREPFGPFEGYYAIPPHKIKPAQQIKLRRQINRTKNGD